MYGQSVLYCMYIANKNKVVHSSLFMICPHPQIVRQVNVGPDVMLTQVVLSNSGRMLFTGTSSGAVRAIKFPLTEPVEWQEHHAHSAAVTRVRYYIILVGVTIR